MTYLTRALVLTSILALSACARNAPFEDGSAIDLKAAGGMNQGAAGAADPTSPVYFQQSIGDRVLFAVDQSTLSPEARATLDAQAAWLSTNADYNAIIEGHADEQGTREYNLALGARRANAVREYLQQRGIPASRLQTVSYGKERPIEVCSDEACYSKNRRAVTVIASGLTG